MNICFVTNKLVPAGAETLILDIVRRASAIDGIEFTVCSIEPPTGLVEDLKAVGARVVSVDAAFKPDPRVLGRLARFLRNEEFDILHAHLPYAQTLGRVFGRLSGVEAVISTQHNFPEQYHPVTRTLERVTRPLDDATVAVSRAVETAFTGEPAHCYPERNGQWTTIYNGVDIDRFAEEVATADGERVRDRHGIDTAASVFLNVGRYVPKKNQRGIIESFAQVCTDVSDAHLLLVGWGDLRDDLEAAARAHGVGESVTVTGRVNPIHPYYAAADAFVSASRAESFGLVLVEAFAAGLSVVGPDVPGAREVLKRGGGSAVRPDGPDEIATAMRHALADPPANDAGSMAVFDIGTTVDKHLGLYRELLEEKGLLPAEYAVKAP